MSANKAQIRKSCWTRSSCYTASYRMVGNFCGVQLFCGFDGSSYPQKLLNFSL